MIILLWVLTGTAAIAQEAPVELKDQHHGVAMGIPHGGCDDGKTNLSVDWDGDSLNHTCFSPREPFWPDPAIDSSISCNNSIPDDYYPQHHCMSKTITYESLIPTFGDHRPLWPRYGEYKFVPRQRWLHNVEHGAIVMLYHPCTLASEVDRLRQIVKSCIKKHIITPITFLSQSRPMALVAWGCIMTMSSVNDQHVVQFIREKGMRGPEGTHGGDGQYSYQLMEASSSLRDNLNDDFLCLNYP